MVKALVTVLLIVGTLGSVFPGFPGTWIVGLTTVIYGLLTGFQTISLPWVIVSAGLVIAAEMAEYAVGVAGARRFGADRVGIIGAVLGSIIGAIVLGPLGLIIGPIIGAFLLETASNRSPREAIRAGIGATLGALGGALVKFILTFAATLLVLTRIY